MPKPLNWRISPNYHRADVGETPTIDDKVRVFVDRVDGWMLTPAEKLIELDADGSGFAVLAILVAYFEMIAKLIELPVRPGEKGGYFRAGLELVLESRPGCQLAARDVGTLYGSLRNGLFHVGFPERDIAIDDSIDVPVGRREQHPGYLLVNPKLMTEMIREHLTKFSFELRQENRVAQRNKFSSNFIVD